MKKIVAIIAGDPNSINSEIIGKTWKKKSKFKNTNILILGNYILIKKQFKKLGFKFGVKQIKNFDKQDFNKNLLIYNIPLKFKNIFKIPASDKASHILSCFDVAIRLVKKKKISGFINCPINKIDTFGKNFFGITEFLAKKERVYGKEVMLIYNKILSVSPLTTHIKLKSVPRHITKNKIINKIKIINNFFIKNFKIKPKIGVLGLNPHNDELRKDSEEIKKIIPAIKKLKRDRISIIGPLSPDTAFLNFKDYDVLVGMYHDQVLAPYKSLFKFNAINITLGIPYLRISPDHGVGKNIINKRLANPQSLIESVKFFNNKNVKT